MTKISTILFESISSTPWYIELSTLLFMVSLVIYLLLENDTTTKKENFSQNQIDVSVKFLMANLALMINCDIYCYVSNRTTAKILIAMISVISIILICNLKKLPIWEER